MKQLTFALALALCFAFSIPAAHGAEKKDFHFWVPCTKAQMDAYRKGVKAQVWESALDLASCYATNVSMGKGDALTESRKGREFADLAVMKMPQSADAHYLLAVLIGYVAQNDPWYDQMSQGLDMVPKIQHQAEMAAKIDPKVDNAGPDYVLGQLYLQAPAPPMSVGSVKKALTHFRLAVKIAPKSVANHVGLAQAYLQNNETPKACAQIKEALQLPRPTLAGHKKFWDRAKKIQQNSCSN